MSELRKQPVHEADWDYLIVLDACRYDVFEEVYEEYFDGELSKVESRACNTMEWLPETFDGRYNYTYVSGNPYVNSKGLSIGEMYQADIPWTATEHITRIIDVWDDYWDGDTVHPRKITDKLVEVEDTPVIAHYMQPHTPFLSTDSDPGKGIIWRTAAFFFHRLPKPVQTEVKDRVTIPGSEKFSSYHEQIVENHGKDYLRQKYRENLEIALEDIQRVVEEKEEAKIVITADHGERLGENDKYGHPRGKTGDVLLNVPWLELEGVSDN